MSTAANPSPPQKHLLRISSTFSVAVRGHGNPVVLAKAVLGNRIISLNGGTVASGTTVTYRVVKTQRGLALSKVVKR